MKKMLQNAQVRDFIGATFCLVMTFALFLMYTGCTFVMAGGAAEETSVEAAYDAPNDTSEKDSVKLALYDNVRLAGRVRSVEQPANSAPMSSTSMDTTFRIVESEWAGLTVWLSELDSVTLEPTGVRYVSHPTDSSGSFNFDSISLNSPFVMLELSPYHADEWASTAEVDEYGYIRDYDETMFRYMLVYKTIVDLHDSAGVEINSLTFLATPRIRNLVKQGMNFAAAKLQAGEEVLASLGVYGVPFDMQNPKVVVAEEHLGYVLEDWTRYSSASIITEEFAMTGTFNDNERIRFSVSRWIFNWYEYYLYYHYGTATDDEIAFMSNFLASYEKMEQCSAENEGDTVKFYDLLERRLTAVCQSGEWTVAPSRYTMDEKVEFSSGTMTDARDGKTYKTVTYKIDGQSQTWFAENLIYSDEDVQPFIGLTSYLSNLVKGRSEFTEYMDSLDSAYWNTVALYEESDVVGGDSIHMDGAHFQGLCPDGWHIPTNREWSHLMYFVEVETGMSSREKAQEILQYEYDFGWYASMYLRDIGFGDFTLEPFAMLGSKEDGGWEMMSLLMDNWKPMAWRADKGLAVRCVKD